jgi:hypothetical protein
MIPVISGGHLLGIVRKNEKNNLNFFLKNLLVLYVG